MNHQTMTLRPTVVVCVKPAARNADTVVGKSELWRWKRNLQKKNVVKWKKSMKQNE